MAGEMRDINVETGEDDRGNVWWAHAAVAKAVDGTLCPFDQYQGPYIHGKTFKLWVYNGNEGPVVYDEVTQRKVIVLSESVEGYTEAARLLVSGDFRAIQTHNVVIRLQLQMARTQAAFTQLQKQMEDTAESLAEFMTLMRKDEDETDTD